MDSKVSSKQRKVQLIGVASGRGVPARVRNGSVQAATVLKAAGVDIGMRRNRVDCAWDELVAVSSVPHVSCDAELRLLWIDAHLDAHTSVSSLSGNAHRRHFGPDCGGTSPRGVKR